MIKRFIHRTSGAGGEGGASPETTDQALKAIGDNVENFVKKLGDKADSTTVESLKASLADLQANFDSMKASEIESAIKSINADNKKLWDQVLEMQVKAAESAESKGGTSASKQMYTKESLKEFAEKSIRDKRSGGASLEIEELKAAETFGIPESFVAGQGADTALVASGYQLVPGLFAKRRKTNIMLDYFPIQTINVPYLIYLEKVDNGTGTAPNNGGGGAAWIESGEAKPKRSFRITAVKAEAKKLAIFGTIEDCLLMDVNSFDNWIRTDFNQQLDETANRGLLKGNPSVNVKEPMGLITNATQYAVTPSFDETVLAANYIDAIIAASASMVTNHKYAAERAFVSRDVWFRIIALKDNNARYMNNPLVYVSSLGELYIAGVHIVPVDAEDVASTHLLLVGADAGFRILRYGNAGIETGLNGNDFQEDKTSYRAWRRYITYFPSDTRGSVMYDTFDNILSAIEKPVPAG